MSTNRHAENRAWAFAALDELEAFLEDPDFHGIVDDERAAIDKKRTELRDNKYRVVVLGEFNVGKSALINAFLGDEYLPTVLEECTTKTTHVLRGESMRAVLRLTEEATDAERDELTKLLTAQSIPATVENGDGPTLCIDFAGDSGRDMMKTLRPLVTMSADEDFPQVRTLRAKLEEIVLCVPNPALDEDVALIDSPGVHSISESNNKISQEVIPNSHLVLCVLDGQSTGTEHDREFIEKIAKYRHRKLFFVINKSDQLNPDEIDLTGHRGPARDLCRSLVGIVEKPEMFFVSSLYALLSQMLAQEKLELESLDNNNKVKIPFGMYQRLFTGEDPRQGVAEYLLKQSRFQAFRERLLDYLFNENREGAVLEAICRFIDACAWAYARPIQVKMDMARDVPRLEELKTLRENLYQAMEHNSKTSVDVLNTYNAMATGGAVGGKTYPGFESVVEERMNPAAAQASVLKPVLDWLNNDENLRKARKAKYQPLAQEVERRIDAFGGSVADDVNTYAAEAEEAALARMGDLRGSLQPGMVGCVQPPKTKAGAFKAGMAGSYFGFLVAGGIIGAAMGAAIGYYVPDVDQQMALAAGAAIGAGAGGLAGLIARAITAKRVIRRKLTRAVTERIDQILFRGASEKAPGRVTPLREQVKDQLSSCRTAFTEAVQGVLDRDMARLNREMNDVAAEEADLKAKQKETIERLEPKCERLIGLGKTAHALAELNVPKEAAALPEA